jgi:molecular chaperone HtpG
MSSAVAMPLLSEKRHSLSGMGAEAEVVIGKDVLELITGAMYVDPMTIFREYIQNAADSIDVAQSAKLYRAGVRPRIDISLDAAARSIRIRDNGAGIAAAEFWSRMTSIGASAKRGTRQRGFRGVGRLSGLGYATEVVFRSCAAGEHRVSELSWSGRRLREVLRDARYEGGLDAVIREVATRSAPIPSKGESFFEVELKGVARVGNDMLLNPDEVRAYLGQNAPVPFSSALDWTPQLQEFLASHGIGSGLDIYLTGDDLPIHRPLTNRIRTHGRNTDALKEIEFFEIPSLDGSTQDAVGWLIHHSYLGAVPKSTGYAGLRLRSGNIQVGSPGLLDPLFTEPRFNAWCIGEIHVLSGKIIPNGRRDDFELNGHYQNLLSHATSIASRVSKLCRDRSIQRNRVRRAALLRQLAEEQLLILRDRKSPTMIKEHYRKLVMKTLGQLRRIAEDKKFSAEDQRAISKIADSLEKSMADVRRARATDQTAAFIPSNHRKFFVDTLKMMIAACDTPEQAAQLTRKVFDKARRRYSSKR